MKDICTTELFEKLVREHRLAHEKFTERQLADCIRQMVLAGDFERHVDVLHQQAIVYIPYARQHELECERDELRRQVADFEKRMEEISKQTGLWEELENARCGRDSAEAEARNARHTAFYGTGNNMSATKLFQFPNTVTVDLNQIQKTSHVYFRYVNEHVVDAKAFFLKLTFMRGGEEEFYLGDSERDAEEIQRQLINRWAQDK